LRDSAHRVHNLKTKQNKTKKKKRKTINVIGMEEHETPYNGTEHKSLSHQCQDEPILLGLSQWRELGKGSSLGIQSVPFCD
jgi:hypothetical protein